MIDRTGQVWKLGGKAIYVILAPPTVVNDPLDWTFGMSGSLEHCAFELEDGYQTMLLELNEGDWESDGYRKRLL